jgi:hypothetical protein
VLLLLLCIFSGGLVLPRAYLGVVLPPYTLCFDGVSLCQAKSSPALTPFPHTFLPLKAAPILSLSPFSYTRADTPPTTDELRPHNRPPHHHGPFQQKCALQHHPCSARFLNGADVSCIGNKGGTAEEFVFDLEITLFIHQLWSYPRIRLVSERCWLCAFLLCHFCFFLWGGGGCIPE